MSKQLLNLSPETQEALLGLTLGATNAPALTLIEKGPLPPVLGPAPKLA